MKKNYTYMNKNQGFWDKSLYGLLGWRQLAFLLMFCMSLSYGQGVGYGNGTDGNNGVMGSTSAVVFLDISGATTKHAMSVPAAWGGGCDHDGGADNIGDVGKSTPYVLPTNIAEIKLKGELLQASSNSANRNFALEYKWYHESESEPSWTARTPVYMNSGHTSSYCGNLKHAMSTWYTLPLTASGTYYLKVRFRMHNSQDGSLSNANNYHGGFIEGYTARFSYNPETIWYKADGGTDLELSASGSNNYALNNASVSGGNGYFYNKLSGGSTTKYWAGVTNFPTGTAVSSGSLSGTKIASTAGLYNIAFNSSTGAYTFTSILGSSQKITSAKVTMDVTNSLTSTTTTGWYLLNGSQSTLSCHQDVGNTDFNPANASAIHTLGVNSTLKIGGEVLTNNDPNPIKMHYRVYLVGATPPAFTTVNLKLDRFLTTGTECGNKEGLRGTKYIRIASEAPTTVTLSLVGDYYVEVYYEAGGTMTSGTGPWTAGGYSMIGDAAAGWGTDIPMGVSATDKFHYYNYTFTTNGLKFRTTGAWTTSYGKSTNFPYSTSSDNTNIPVTAGTYNVTFDRTTSTYYFAPYNTSSTYFNNSDGSNYKALIRVVDVVDENNKDTNDGSFGFTDGSTDPGCTQCTGLYESYMGLYILDADGAIVADRVYNLDGAYGSANTSNLDLGAQYPGVTFRIGTEVKAWAKGKHKMCGCSSWYYVYDFDGTNPVETDFPLPAAGSEFTATLNGKFTLMNSSEELGSNTKIPLNPVNTSGQGSGAFTSTVNTSTALGLAYQNLIKSANIQGYNHGSALPPESTYSVYMDGSTTDQNFLNVNGYSKSTGGNYGGNDRIIYDRYITAAEAASWMKIRNNGAAWDNPWGDGASWNWTTNKGGFGTASSPGSNITVVQEGNYTIHFDISTGSLSFDLTTLYRWKDFTNAATTTSVNTPYNPVACPTCGGEYKIAVALLCWASSTGNCSTASSLYYHRDINQNKMYKGIALNPHHPDSVDKPVNSKGNTLAGTDLFYNQKISIASAGAVNTYSAGTWSVTGATLPQSYQDAYVNSDLTIPDGTGFTCINLVVADGVTITLGANSYIEVLRAATTTGTGKIVVPTNANFVQRCDDQPSTANIVHTKNTRSIAYRDYSYMASPITEDMIPIVTTAGMGRMYEWTSGAGGGWRTISTTVGKNGRGFIAWNPSTEDTVFSPIIAGTAFNGEASIAVSNVDLDATKSTNYALLGNPYACAVDGEKFLQNANNAHIAGTLYYWSSNTRLKDGSATGYGNYNAQDYNPADYASWNLAAGTGTAASASKENEIGNSVAPTKFIPSGVGFFVRTLAAGNAYFNNSMRSTTTNLATFYRNSDPDGSNSEAIDPDRKKSRLWINLNNGKGGFKQSVIAYVPGATEAPNDRLYDSPNYSLSKSLIYTVNGKEKLSIEGRPYQLLKNNETIPLGVKSDADDEYQVSIDSYDGDFDKKNIFLNDKVNDTIHNLSKTPYLFKTNSGTYDERFEIIIRDKESKVEEVIEELKINKNLSVAVNAKGIDVANATEEIVKIEIYSILGSKIYEKDYDSVTSLSIIDLKRLQQVVIVKVTYKDGYKESRKVVY